jgi:ribosomal protein L15
LTRKVVLKGVAATAGAKTSIEALGGSIESTGAAA